MSTVDFLDMTFFLKPLIMGVFNWIKGALQAFFDSSLYARRIIDADVQIDIDKQYCMENFYRRNWNLKLTKNDSLKLLGIVTMGLLWTLLMKVIGFSLEGATTSVLLIIVIAVAYPFFLEEQPFTHPYYLRLFCIGVGLLFLIENLFLDIFGKHRTFLVSIGGIFTYFVVMTNILAFYTFYKFERLLCLVEHDYLSIKEFHYVISSIDNWYYYIKNKPKFTRVPYLPARKVIVKHLIESCGVFHCMKDFISRTTIVDSNLPDVFETTSDEIKTIFDNLHPTEYCSMIIQKYAVFIHMLRSDVFTELYFNLLYNESIFVQIDQINRFYYLYRMITRPSFSEKAYKELLKSFLKSRLNEKPVQNETIDEGKKTELLNLLYIIFDLIEQSSTIQEIQPEMNEIIERIYDAINERKFKNRNESEESKQELFEEDEKDENDEEILPFYYKQKVSQSFIKQLERIVGEQRVVGKHMVSLYSDERERGVGDADLLKDFVIPTNDDIDSSEQPLSRNNLISFLEESLKKQTEDFKEVIYDSDE